MQNLYTISSYNCSADPNVKPERITYKQVTSTSLTEAIAGTQQLMPLYKTNRSSDVPDFIAPLQNSFRLVNQVLLTKAQAGQCEGNQVVIYRNKQNTQELSVVWPIYPLPHLNTFSFTQLP
jgi:hypothetical protein